MAKSPNEHPKRLIFDFDGVLIDSLDEVVLTVYNTATAQLMMSLAEVPPPLVGLFRRNRFHVQPIGDGIVLMNWCLENYRDDPERILKPDEYQAIIGAASEPVARRSNRVYKTRQRFIDRDDAAWTALHRPVQPLWQALVRRQDLPGFAIVTNKNRAATQRLCRQFGLNISPANVYSGDNGTSKIENMHKIQHRFGAEMTYFLDDSLKNLQELDQNVNRQKKILIPLLAAWGYLGPEDQKLASRSGCQILTQPEAIALLSKVVPL